MDFDVCGFVRKTATLVAAVILVSCEELDNDIEKHASQEDSTCVALDDVAKILSSVPLRPEHLREVHDAVVSSSENGYDEEYLMKDLFSFPGKGVGEDVTRSSVEYEEPLRELIEAHVRSFMSTKGTDGPAADPERFLGALMDSDIQIYWPFSDMWNGEDMPVVTFDPQDGSEANVGYMLTADAEGSVVVKEVIVDENMAKARPVWVVNRNSDAGYASLEVLRRENPEWSEGGGGLVVRPTAVSPLKTLILKDFTMKRNYDSWFGGASEFFVKTGSVEDFTASTEAELRLYSPTVTDFMIVVRRSQVGKPQPFNAVLVSDWSNQLTHCAFMMIEDDGGTKTEWKCTALVRVESRSYGIELSLPFSSRDDVVWRGQLSDRWLEANNNVVGHFGDVDLTFEIVESQASGLTLP